MRDSFHFYITCSHPYFNAVILDSILIVWCSIFHCVVHMVFSYRDCYSCSLNDSYSCWYCAALRMDCLTQLRKVCSLKLNTFMKSHMPQLAVVLKPLQMLQGSGIQWRGCRPLLLCKQHEGADAWVQDEYPAAHSRGNICIKSRGKYEFDMQSHIQVWEWALTFSVSQVWEWALTFSVLFIAEAAISA